jgi:hypothetical protein
MADTDDGLGLAMCRRRKARHGYPLVNQRVQPPDIVRPSLQPEWDDSGEEHVTFEGPDDPNYRRMLELIRQTRSAVLAKPRVDMPGAEVVGGQCRMQVLPALPLDSPVLAARVAQGCSVELSWPRTAATIGFQYELHRSSTPEFEPDDSTHLGLTTAGRFTDALPPPGTQYYALVLTTDSRRAAPSFARVDVPAPLPPAPPSKIEARSLPGEIWLAWQSDRPAHVRYHVYRKAAGATALQQLTQEPLAGVTYSDLHVEVGVAYEYVVRAIDRRGQTGPESSAATAVAKQMIRQPVFVASLAADTQAGLRDGQTVRGQIQGQVRFTGGSAQFGEKGHIQYPYRPEFALRHALTVQCWVRIDKATQMPVVLACGEYMKSGWFIQRYGGGWRWHLGGASCDGGRPVVGEWVHLTAAFDGRTARLYQDGVQVAKTDCQPDRSPADRPLIVGQYTRAGPSYQVNGQVGDVKIYQRALSEEEIVAAFEEGPPK